MKIQGAAEKTPQFVFVKFVNRAGFSAAPCIHTYIP